MFRTQVRSFLFAYFLIEARCASDLDLDLYFRGMFVHAMQRIYLESYILLFRETRVRMITYAFCVTALYELIVVIEMRECIPVIIFA